MIAAAFAEAERDRVPETHRQMKADQKGCLLAERLAMGVTHVPKSHPNRHPLRVLCAHWQPSMASPIRR
jgi:hypothetical protein